MIEKDLNISVLFHANMFQNKKTLHMEKILYTMKEMISFTEENVDLAMESRGDSLSRVKRGEKGRRSRKS